MPIVIKKPETDTEYKDYYYFRWKILRKPLGGKLGEEQDGREKDSIHIMVKNEKNIFFQYNEYKLMQHAQFYFEEY